MSPFITDHRDALADLCREHHVRSLFVFGSAAREDFDPGRSDVDLLVEFEPLPEGGYADAYFGLREALEALPRPRDRPRRDLGAPQPVREGRRRADEDASVCRVTSGPISTTSGRHPA